MKYYIIDTTLRGSPTKFFDHVEHALSYLKVLNQRKTGMNYEQYLTHLADLGHFGYDDREFYESIRDSIDIGVLRGEQMLRCNIYEALRTTEGSD
jgi:hypothetical protein